MRVLIVLLIMLDVYVALYFLNQALRLKKMYLLLEEEKERLRKLRLNTVHSMLGIGGKRNDKN